MGNGEQTCGSQGLGMGRAAGTNKARGSGSGGIGGSSSSGERTGGFSRAQASGSSDGAQAGGILGLTTRSAGSIDWARGRDSCCSAEDPSTTQGMGTGNGGKMATVGVAAGEGSRTMGLGSLAGGIGRAACSFGQAMGGMGFGGDRKSVV